MQFCYCDETGTGEEPIALMVGILVDSHRMQVTKSDWDKLLSDLSLQAGHEIDEIHTRDFYSGNGKWRGIDGKKRTEVIDNVIRWLVNRKHKMVVVGVEKEKYDKSLRAGQIKKEVSTIWRFMGIHLILSVQKRNQNKEKNKGHTVFVFDNEEREKMNFSDLVWNPPVWSDSYYEKEKKQSRLDQVVDVPYFVDSKHAPLVQVADFVAYFIRKHLEIESGLTSEKYLEERDKISEWMKSLNDVCVGTRVVYPETGRCEISSMFYNHAPLALKKMLRGKN